MRAGVMPAWGERLSRTDKIKESFLGLMFEVQL